MSDEVLVTLGPGNDRSVVAVIKMPDSTSSVTFSSSSAPLALNNNASLPLALLPAMRSATALRIAGPVSTRLLAATPKVQDTFMSWSRHGWAPDLKHVDVETEAELVGDPGQRGVGCWFSGGVDSWYTILKHLDEITHLVFVRGFDIRPHETELAARATEIARAASNLLGKQLIEVDVDIRRYSDSYVSWSLYHGAAMASVAHLLEPTLSTMYVPASDTYATLTPLGSHPLLDPLWSTEGLEFIHDGCEATRVDKVAFFRNDTRPLEYLRVCADSAPKDLNCGRCHKCTVTMVALRMAGLDGECAALPALDIRAVPRRVRLPTEGGRRLWRIYRDGLRAAGTDRPLEASISRLLRSQWWRRQVRRAGRAAPPSLRRIGRSVITRRRGRVDGSR